MKMYAFNKLIRDKMVDLFKQDGSMVATRVITDNQEYKALLYKKAIEELNEVFEAETRDEMIQELADIEEVFASVRRLYDIQQHEVEAARTVKQGKRGGFFDRLFLTAVRCSEGSRSQECAIKNGYREITQEEYDLLAACSQQTELE